MHTVESNAQDIDDWGCASTLDVSNMAEVITLSGKLFALLRFPSCSNRAEITHHRSQPSRSLVWMVQRGSRELCDDPPPPKPAHLPHPAARPPIIHANPCPDPRGHKISPSRSSLCSDGGRISLDGSMLGDRGKSTHRAGTSMSEGDIRDPGTFRKMLLWPSRTCRSCH
jgi:hypothetical protein